MEKANILMVDDHPGKLLSYEAILSDLGENLLKAHSGNEALDCLLKTDIAVVLIDVCMPDLVLLADDSDVVRRAIRELLEENPDIEFVGEANDFAQTIQMVNELKPQIVLLDLHMKDEVKASPVDVKSRLNDGAQIVAMSFSNDEEARVLAENFGAVAVLDKTELADELLPTIEKLSSPSANA
jgi:DNA-binding NarL/FixJ family response regulator